MREETKELWWIYSPQTENDWAGLRIATFLEAPLDVDSQIVIIHNEMPARLGPRIWADIVEREGWVKVREIELPDADEVAGAFR